MPDLAPLPALPPQPVDVSWPTLLWPHDELPDGVDEDQVERLLSGLFDSKNEARLGATLAVLVVQGGRVVAERYARGVHAASTLISWSMAKSMLHAVLGVLVRDGRIDLDAPAAVPEWSDPDDPRHPITLRQLLQFRDGLRWREDYVDDRISDVIAMLFGTGKEDMAAYAATRPLDHHPGSTFNYSSGASNIVSRIVRDLVGAGPDYEAFLRRELFDPLGMAGATPTFDDVGTWVASSYVHATPRDFARFGLLYLRDGVWEDRRLLPEGWVDFGRTESAREVDGRTHGAHWWGWWDNPWGAFNASGYEGQYLVVAPALDLVLVRLGKTPAELKGNLVAAVTDLIRAFDPERAP